MGKKKFWVFSIIPILIILFSVTAYAQSDTIPGWIKTNAGWWSEDQISDSEYISGLQYMINEGILRIPITKVIATDTTVSDEIQAHSIVVRMDFPEGEETYYSFSRILEYGENVGPQSTPELVLESIPSYDKTRFYEEVEKTLRGKETRPFSVFVDIIAKDGNLIETLEYMDCTIVSNWVYVNADKNEYRIGKIDGSEIRELSYLTCTGYFPKFP